MPDKSHNKSVRASVVATFPAPMIAALVRGARSCVRLGPFTHGKAIHHRQRFYKLRKAMQEENHSLAPIAIKTTIRLLPCNGQTKACKYLDTELNNECDPHHYLEIDSDEKDELVMAIRDAGIDIEMDEDDDAGFDAGKDEAYHGVVDDDSGDQTESTIRELFPDE